MPVSVSGSDLTDTDDEGRNRDLFSDEEEDERRRHSGEENGGGDEEQKKPEKQIKPKRTGPVKRMLLSEEHLLGKNGLIRLEEIFANFKFREKGYEKLDLDLMLHKYEHWCHSMHPKHPFGQVLERIEFLGMKKRPVKTLISKIRMGMVTGVNYDHDAVFENENDAKDHGSDFENPERANAILEKPPEDDWQAEDDDDDLFATIETNGDGNVTQTQHPNRTEAAPGSPNTQNDSDDEILTVRKPKSGNKQRVNSVESSDEEPKVRVTKKKSSQMVVSSSEDEDDILLGSNQKGMMNNNEETMAVSNDYDDHSVASSTRISSQVSKTSSMSRRVSSDSESDSKGELIKASTNKNETTKIIQQSNASTRNDDKDDHDSVISLSHVSNPISKASSISRRSYSSSQSDSDEERLTSVKRKNVSAKGSKQTTTSTRTDHINDQNSIMSSTLVFSQASKASSGSRRSSPSSSSDSDSGDELSNTTKSKKNNQSSSQSSSTSTSSSISSRSASQSSTKSKPSQKVTRETSTKKNSQVKGSPSVKLPKNSAKKPGPKRGSAKRKISASSTTCSEDEWLKSSKTTEKVSTSKHKAASSKKSPKEKRRRITRFGENDEDDESRDKMEIDSVSEESNQAPDVSRHAVKGRVLDSSDSEVEDKPENSNTVVEKAAPKRLIISDSEDD